jgi:ureidoglycolate hydrolase
VRRIRLKLETATHESFAPFGALPADEGSEHDTARLEFLLDDGGLNFISHTNDEIPFADDGAACCELLNRHDTHTQTLVPYDTDAYAVVAPAGVDFSQPEHFGTVRAFLLPRYAVVHLSRGTWHWGPYPLAAESVRILNVQGRGYPDDNGIAWLARDHDTTYEIERG